MKKTFFEIIVSILLLTSSTFASTTGGNGGGVHYCFNGSVQMYDLYEGYNRHNIKTYINPNYSVDDYINRALNKIKNFDLEFSRKIRGKIKYMNAGNIIMRKRIELRLVPDANILFVDEGCEYRQLANWDDLSGNIIVKEELFDKLATVDKAAFYLHEAIYSFHRDVFRKDISRRHLRVNSDLARYEVSDIMSESRKITKRSPVYKRLFRSQPISSSYLFQMYGGLFTNDFVEYFNRDVQEGLFEYTSSKEFVGEGKYARAVRNRITSNYVYVSSSIVSHYGYKSGEDYHNTGIKIRFNFETEINKIKKQVLEKEKKLSSQYGGRIKRFRKQDPVGYAEWMKKIEQIKGNLEAMERLNTLVYLGRDFRPNKYLGSPGWSLRDSNRVKVFSDGKSRNIGLSEICNESQDLTKFEFSIEIDIENEKIIQNRQVEVEPFMCQNFTFRFQQALAHVD